MDYARDADAWSDSASRHHCLLVLVATLGLLSPGVDAAVITHARYDDPVQRYGHFAAGHPHEYARLTVQTDSGHTLALDLPQDEVFEDVQPRLVRLSADTAPLLLTIVSSRGGGARLALMGLDDGRLVISAQSRELGTPMRWLNPVGVADLDGDGIAEIAAVTTPHIGGTLRIYRKAGGELQEIATLAGFSNHVYGSPELGLSTPMSVQGRMRLLVPDTNRRQLRVIALEGGSLKETGRCELQAPVTGAITIASPAQSAIETVQGRQLVTPGDCP